MKLSMRFFLSVSFVLAACAAASVAGAQNAGYTVGTYPGEIRLQELTPASLVAMLSDPSMLQVPGYRRVRIDKPVRNWIRESDVPELLELMDSTAPCLALNIPQSSFLPDRTTVGDIAAYLVDSYRNRMFPHSLYSKRYSESEKAELRRWWRRYLAAEEMTRGD